VNARGPNPYGWLGNRRPRRLYTREQMDAARAAWDEGDFSSEWHDWRHLAAMEGGIISAPAGSAWDSWADDDPSERAILIRAIRETPELLAEAIRAPGPPTWAKVVARLVGRRDEMREEVTRDEREADRERERRSTASREAAYRLREILDVIKDS
jgi:hypothetical protein